MPNGAVGRGPLTAAVFDVDGVLIASPHERAWRETLAELLGPDVAAPFTTVVYQERVAGRPRLAGARAVLDWLGIPDAEVRSIEYARRKQRRLEELIDAGDFTAFPDALRFVTALRARGFRLAAASSSRNATALMASIPFEGVGPNGTLLEAFAANVSGTDRVRGKPYPDLFLLAAEQLAVAPSSCLVVEDAPVGVQAAKAGAMRAIGIARAGDAGLLRMAGADLVVTTLDDVDLGALADGRVTHTARATATRRGPAHDRVAAAMEPTPDHRWVLRQSGYSFLGETGIESRFAVSNGFLGVRGSRAASRGPMWMSFLHTLSWASWPRTFVAGLFDTPDTEPPVPALAPVPDWLRLRVLLDGTSPGRRVGQHGGARGLALEGHLGRRTAERGADRRGSLTSSSRGARYRRAAHITPTRSGSSSCAGARRCAPPRANGSSPRATWSASSTDGEVCTRSATARTRRSVS